MSNSSANDSKSGPATKIKAIAIGVIAALVLCAGLYFYGISQGRSELAAQKTDYENRLSAAKREVRNAQSDLAIAQNRAFLMQSRAALYRTATDLDRRNFGTANDHLKEAAQALAGIKNSEKLKTDQISALQSAIASANINVATDLESQRARVLDFAQQLDKLTPVEAGKTALEEEKPAPELKTGPE